MLGKKIENLTILSEKDFPVPEFIVVKPEDEPEKITVPWELCSVRSSGNIEDGAGNSFAGQFDTYLNVPAADVAEKIRLCRESVKKETVQAYLCQNNMSEQDLEMNVIVQRMISADFSGVCFTANPQGLLNETVIVAGRGTGDNVVEDKTDTTTYFYNITDGNYYYEGTEDYLRDNLVQEIVRTAAKMKLLLGEYLDIEFAVADGKLYILQARDITTIRDDSPLILDNSNIVESYPGISLPLTCSFVNIVYSGIFRSISKRVLKNKKQLAKYEDVFANMVGDVNGRMYYKISNWYTIIKFLPMNHKIIPVWQDMLGVKVKTYDAEAVKLPFYVRVGTYFNVVYEMLRVPTNMKRLNADFVKINDGFYERYHEDISIKELTDLYRELYDTLFACWDVTLLNDMYAFLFTGMVKKRMGEESNRVISGISNIESLKPIKEMIRLAYDKNNLSEEEYKQRFEAYIREYGDRNLEELKLESKTFRSHPELLEEKLKQYCEDSVKLEDMYNKLHAENEEVTKPIKGLNAFLVKQAAKGIANREISRLNRSRIFGIVRLIFTKMGQMYADQGLLDAPEDVFWITADEVFALAENPKLMQEIVFSRKAKYELFYQLPAYQRLIFMEKEFDKNHRSINAHVFNTEGNKLQGTPCSDGVVEGEALVVTDVTKVKDYKDKILVTKMTDPGWVFLLVSAKGVISEKGSLLSHTAIISREIKIPSVVGVENLMSTIKTGDILRMNGNTGEIEILKS